MRSVVTALANIYCMSAERKWGQGPKQLYNMCRKIGAVMSGDCAVQFKVASWVRTHLQRVREIRACTNQQRLCSAVLKGPIKLGALSEFDAITTCPKTCALVREGY